MILILSEETDTSTDMVIDWLLAMRKEFIRINDTSCLKIKTIHHSGSWKAILQYEDQQIDFDKITAYWYRRGNLNIDIPDRNVTAGISSGGEIRNNLNQEIYILRNFLHYLLQSKNCIGSYLDNDVNKLVNLDIAYKCGLRIPETIISSDKSVLQDFIARTDNCITKAISDTIFISDNKDSLLAYTTSVKQSDVDSLPGFVFPSLLQMNICKKYELRIFYLDGDFYSMAIFSQKDTQTQEDFRNYNFQRPNRQVPYNLPSGIQRRLKKFMKAKSLKSGSIDMIVSDKDEYFFLEVNPVGQYGMTSQPCNYHLDHKIAAYLCK